MKKSISLFLILALILPCILVHANAIGVETTLNDTEVLACEVFPEYASIIRGENLSSATWSRSTGERELVVYETREISDDHRMTYMQYSDGIAIIADELNPEYSFSDSTTTGESYTRYTSTLTVDVNFSSDTFKVTNLKYTINSNSYDQITGRGSIDTSDIYDASHDSNYQLNETSTSRAFCKYTAWFNPSPGLTYVTPFKVDITFYVGRNSREVVID